MPTSKFTTALKFALLVSVIGFRFDSSGQNNPSLRIADMDYLYSGNVTTEVNPGTGGRIVFALQDSMASLMAGSLVAAMNERWGSQLIVPKMNVDKADNMFGVIPPFKPKTKHLEPGKQNVFIRIIDRGPMVIINPMVNPDTDSTQANILNVYSFSCKVIDGTTNTISYSRDMDLELVKEMAPPGQYVLNRLPAIPRQFLQAFDSAARFFFSSANALNFQIQVKPACILLPDSIAKKARQILRFENNGKLIREAEAGAFAWTLEASKLEKTGRVNKMVGNILGGLFTGLTGVGTEHASVTRHLASVEMKGTGDTASYIFRVPLLREERTGTERVKEKTSSGNTYTLASQDNSSVYIYPDANRPCILELANDTIATFKISYNQKTLMADVFKYCWDGKDSASISPVPMSWGDNFGWIPLQINGTVYGKPFTIQNTRDEERLDTWYDSTLVATFHVTGNRPRDGVINSDTVPPTVSKALALFTCLPYNNWLLP